MEEGVPEEEAVAAAGSVEEIAAQILAEFPQKEALPERQKPKKQWRVWEIVLLVLGSPLWLSLLLTVFSILLALYVSLWAIIVSLWSIPVSLAACAIAGLIAGAVFVFVHRPIIGAALFGAGLICAGLSLLLFFLCGAVSKGAVWLTKRIFLCRKRTVNKEESR